jgi:hypothetical protein
MTIRILFIAALLAGAGPIPGGHLAAQEPGSATEVTGRLLGQVRDAATGLPLPGAQVLLNDGPRGVVAGVEGRFQMDRVPVGAVSIQVLLIGYAPHTITDIEVGPDGVTRVEALLERRAVEVAGITVEARQAGGTAVSLLREQRSATGVVNAISAEQISRSPDGDAAGAIKRVSGVSVQDGKFVFVRGLGERYTTSSLNGSRIPSSEPERRVVPLDLFPTNLIESISTQKTFTPDQPGDFSGGSVNIRTPDFPSRQLWSLSLSTGFHPDITGQPILSGPTAGGEWLAMATEPREIPRAAEEFPGTASRGPQVNEVVNSFRNVWSVRETTGQLPISSSASVGGAMGLFDHTLGYLGSLTYSLSDEVQLEQRRARAGSGETEIDRYDGESGTSSVLWGGLVNLSALLGSHSQLHLSNTYNRSADHTARREAGLDENTRSAVQVDRLSYVERTVRSHQLRGEHQLGTRHRVDWNVNAAGVSRSEPDRSEFVTWLDPEVPVWFNDFEGAVRTFGSLEETSLETGATYAFSFGENQGTPHRLRAGIFRRTIDRNALSQGFRIQAFTWAPQDPRWQLDPEEFFDGRFAGPEDSDFLLSRELSGGSYDATDELVAGFLMAEVQVTDRLQLVGGARIEDYALEVNSENQLGQPALTQNDYTDILPSLGMTFSVTPNQQLRLSASRTLARPEYREVAPITYREVLGGEQLIGNMNLERTLIRNLDARWEWYPAPDEVISLGVFGKWFDNPIEQRFLARSGTDTRTFENAESATNHGVEFEAITGLRRVSPLLRPLSLFANVTVMRSRVHTGQEGDVERAMVGQAPFVLNTGVTYSAPTQDWSATLLYNVVGERIVNARASGTQVDDVVERPGTWWTCPCGSPFSAVPPASWTSRTSWTRRTRWSRAPSSAKPTGVAGAPPWGCRGGGDGRGGGHPSSTLQPFRAGGPCGFSGGPPSPIRGAVPVFLFRLP